jgi:hypothetical protein
MELLQNDTFNHLPRLFYYIVMVSWYHGIYRPSYVWRLPNQNIDPAPPSSPGECVPPPPFGVGGRHTRWVKRGVGGQYFGRRQTLLCILHM